MKKILNIFLIINILFCYLFPIGIQFNVKAEEVEYVVSELNKDGSLTEIGKYTDYNEAKQKMNEHKSDASKVAVIYRNGKLINAKYAMVKFNPRDTTINLYQTSTSSVYYTYTHPSYGLDAAFIDYDPNTNRVKLKISGFTGWADLGDSTGDYLNIVPITKLYTNNLRINENIKDALNVREDASSSSNYIGYVVSGQIFSYTEKKENGGFTWYKIWYNGRDGWIANVDNGISEDVETGLKTYYQNWGETGNLLHYFAYNTSGVEASTYTNLGPSPDFLTAYKIYYSFDGNYFYDDLIKMLDDYKNDNYDNAINKNNPFFAYYLYLPNRSQTSYTADDLNYIIEQKGYYSKPAADTKYVDDNGNFIGGINRNGISQMVGEGASFIASQELYGVNALLTFSAAINESATGTSALAFAKNNLFGHNAYDSCPFGCATTYKSISDSIYEHARLTGENYNNPNHSYYHGTHYGNKGSGMNVMYASDPYWGEKAAQNYFFADNSYGKADYLYNTIGIKVGSSDIFVYAEPNENSKQIYNVNNDTEDVINIPLIVLDKIQANNNWWYKVYTEIGLDENKNIVTDNYNREYSYGYVKASDLYVSNSQPTINAKDITIKVGDNVNLLKDVTASDTEDGDITSRLTYDTNADFNVPGEYSVTYTVKDKSNFSVSKTVKLIIGINNNVPSTGDKSDSNNNQSSSDKVLKANTDGEFDFEYLKNVDNKLQIKGYLKILGINNDLNTDIKYELRLIDEKGNIKTQKLNRIVKKDDMPFEIESENGFNYTYSWFEGNIDIDSLANGNYTLSVAALADNKVAESIVSNVFGFEMAPFFKGKNKNALIINNYDSREVPIQLFIRDDFVSEKNANSRYNIYNEYDTIDFQNSKLVIKGVSHIIGGDYAANTNVKRTLYFENVDTFEKFTYDIGSIDNGEYTVELRVPDGFDKTRAWYNATLDVSNIPKGTYSINVATSSNVSDFGELQDVFNGKINTTFVQNNKKYSFKVDKNNRYRILMIVE